MDLRKILVGVLTVAIVSPAWGGGEPLGSITASRNATVRDTKLMPGSTLFNGDAISVGEHGATQIALSGGGQAEILASSLVRVMKSDNKIQVVVDQGQASVHSSGAKDLELLVADATIRSGDNGASSAVIQSLSKTHAVIAAEKGTLVFTTANDDKTYTLREGEAADLSVAPDEQQGPAPAGRAAPGTPRRRKKAVIWVVVTLSAGVAIASYFLLRDEAQLTPTQLGNEISPSKLQ